ncbi:MAG: hypothetical protein QXY36_00300 [Sulfolobales archaeon]
MTYFELLKEVQEITLTHERLLNRLRVELGRFSRGSNNEELVKDLIEDLRYYRRTYINLTNMISKKGVKFNEVRDELYTLLEYNILISLNNELELLTKISKYVREGRMRLIMLEDVLNDIESVNIILNHLSNAIYSTD